MGTPASPSTGRPPRPEQALAVIEPAKRAFALSYAEGTTNVAQAARELQIGRTTYYEWARDPAVLAFAEAVAGDTSGRARRRLIQLVNGALDTLERALTDARVTPTMLRAATEVLDRVGLTDEAALAKLAAQEVEPVLNVHLSMPTNPHEAAEQQERRQRREARALEARCRAGGTNHSTPDVAD